MNTVISHNLRKTSERIDPSGNVINPRTKQVIRPVEVEATPPAMPQQAPQAITPIVIQESNPLSIQQQIDEAKANLEKLQELKKLKIAEMKAQLELLEK